MLTTISHVQIVVKRRSLSIGAVIVAKGIGYAAQTALSRYMLNSNFTASR